MPRHRDIVVTNWLQGEQRVVGRIYDDGFGGFRDLLKLDGSHVFCSDQHEDGECPWPQGVTRIQSVSHA